MTTVTSSTDTSAVAAKTSAASSKLTADYDLFLKLLTTQLQYQDPLDPTDTSEYTQQLVQYSQVEQSIQQTATLNDILATLGSQDLTQASNLIGREVEFDSSQAGLGALSAQWGWSASRDVTGLVATIKDENGKTIETRTVEASGASGRLAWDGSLSNGGVASAGTYTIDLKGVDSAGNEVALTVTSIGVVNDVRSANGSVTLGVNGADLPASSLIRITGVTE